MKTKEYVRKYNLDKGGVEKMNHKEFCADLTMEFNASLEFYLAQNKLTFDNFYACVDAIELKWDSINNKTLGNLPEKLWNYFLGAVIGGLRDVYFPDFTELKNKIWGMNGKQILEYISENFEVYVSSYSSDSSYMIDLTLKSLQKFYDSRSGILNRQTIEIVETLLEKLESIKNKREKQEEERRRKEYEEYRDRQQRFRSNFYSFYSELLGLSFTNVPTQSFELLGLSSNCSEEDIKKSYRTLSLKHHPDKGGDKEKFIEITEAKNKCLTYLQSNKN